jgi:O-antigen ligase
MIEGRSSNSRLNAVVSAGVFLYFSLMFALPSGYSYGAMMLLLGSFYFLAKGHSLTLSREDKTIIYAFVGLFAWSAFIVLLHDNSPKTLDQTSRFLLAIPVLILLLHIPPRLRLVWAGVVAGIVLSTGIAMWQLQWLNQPRAAGFLNIIHFGNIGLVFGVFCMAGMLWAGTQGRHARAWRIAFFIGMCSSVYAIVASGSRGSWLAVPPVLLIFVAAFLHKKNVKYAAGGAVVVVAAAAALFAIPETGIEQRYGLAVTEVHKYQEQKYVGQGEAVSSVGARLEVWRTALMNIPQRPWLGWPEDDYEAELQRLVQAKEIDPYMLNMANAHNNYLEVLLLQGVVGLIALLAVFLLPLWFFCRRLRSDDITVKALALCGSSLVASYMMFAISQVILGRNNGVIFYVLTLAIIWACMRQEESRGRHGAA